MVRVTLILLVMLVFCSCKQKSEESFGDPTKYELELPPFFSEMPLNPKNPLTKEGIELGRMLYYEPLLDGIGNRKCADCHVQSKGFTSYNSNALAHINLGWNKYFLWNGSVEGNLEDAMYFEVEEFFQTDLNRFNKNERYRRLFKQAFGVDRITYKELAYALAQFERTKISGNSKYDKYMAKQVMLSKEELNGLDIYFSEKGDCFHCHGTHLFTDGEFHNNGLDREPDKGRMDVTHYIFDEGAFKTPTLRNIGLTAPYMHDGRFETLEDVVDFYSEGLQYSKTIDPLMKGVLIGGVQLTKKEKSDLLAFLYCLTDSTFTSNLDFSAP